SGVCGLPRSPSRGRSVSISERSRPSKAGSLSGPPAYESRVMKVLVVVHGFPPYAQGGSEIYAHAHACALHREFGDDVLVVTRENAADSPEYALRTEEREGLRIVWINNTFRHTRTFADTYRNDAIAAITDR